MVVTAFENEGGEAQDRNNELKSIYGSLKQNTMKSEATEISETILKVESRRSYDFC